MFGRIEEFLRATRGNVESSLLLAHGEASLVDRFRRLFVSSVFDPADADGTTGRRRGEDAQRESVHAEAWFLSKKRKLLAEYAVGTIDQALLGVMKVPHAFVRIYGLAGKTVVLDEVHAYDTYTGRILDRLIEWLAAAGTTVVLLSATLPSQRRRDLVDAFRSGAGLDTVPSEEAPYPRMTVVDGRGSRAHTFAPRAVSQVVQLERVGEDIDELAERVVALARDGGCVGWICNTVDRAQRATKRVRELAPELDWLLLHARLLPEDCTGREARLERWLGPHRRTDARPERCVVIGTQVLEQSLDIDFDVLVTDVAPVDLVLQRAGRLWRHGDRTNRSPAHTQPRLMVACPDGTYDTADIGGAAFVYEEDGELLIRRTLRLLEDRTSLTLPDDIEPWVEQVYDEAVPRPDDPLFQAFCNYRGRAQAKQVEADQKLMPRPSVVDDPFGDLRVFLDEDDDPLLHQHLRAETRLGRPSIEVVCVERRDGGLYVGDEDDRPLDLEQEPDRAMVLRLVRRSITVTNRAVVPTLQSEKAPEAWSRSSVLRYRRLVPFEDGRAEVGGMTLTLDPELGLMVTK